MISRADLSHLSPGETVTINGVPMRHLGGGLFEPATIGEPILKRFDVNEGETLHGRWAA